MVVFEDQSDNVERRHFRYGSVEDAEADVPTAVAEKRHVHHVEDEEDLRNPRSLKDHNPLFMRSTSPGSALSIHAATSVWSARRGIDPAVAIPIEYHTASYNITNANANELVRTKSAREKAVRGMLGFIRGYRYTLQMQKLSNEAAGSLTNSKLL